MNILPKKRWHVRNRDNKERVRRDEENARLEHIKEEERIALAEQEVRISILRKSNDQQSSIVQVAQAAISPPTSTHINLFESEEDIGGCYKKDNEDYLKEKKAEKESYEQKIGLLTYIGQSSVEAKKKGDIPCCLRCITALITFLEKEDIPWYLGKKDKCDVSNKSSEMDESKKRKLDPIMIVEKNMKQIKKNKNEHKKKKKTKRDSSPPLPSSSKSIEKLREERLKREKAEREKANRLLHGNMKPVDKPVKAEPGRYNSQFNPHIARQNYNRYHPY